MGSITTQQGRSYRDLPKGSLLGNLWMPALPMIIGNVLQNAFSIVDMFFIGKPGPTAVASVAGGGILMLASWDDGKNKKYRGRQRHTLYDEP